VYGLWRMAQCMPASIGCGNVEDSFCIILYNVLATSRKRYGDRGSP
jgi:hypothetical protein